jgi:hypothetical protein
MTMHDMERARVGSLVCHDDAWRYTGIHEMTQEDVGYVGWYGIQGKASGVDIYRQNARMRDDNAWNDMRMHEMTQADMKWYGIGEYDRE